MEKLLKQDEENETELAETLYAYLICERNISAAADYLYIHRNTMTYRLKKIESLVNIDYDDPKERQYLIISYEMHKIKRDRQKGGQCHYRAQKAERTRFSVYGAIVTKVCSCQVKDPVGQLQFQTSNPNRPNSVPSCSLIWFSLRNRVVRCMNNASAACVTLPGFRQENLKRF